MSRKKGNLHIFKKRYWIYICLITLFIIVTFCLNTRVGAYLIDQQQPNERGVYTCIGFDHVIAQTFEAGIDAYLIGASIVLNENLGYNEYTGEDIIPGDLIVEIRTTELGSGLVGNEEDNIIIPAETLLSSTLLSEDNITVNQKQWYDIFFPNPAFISTNSHYALVLGTNDQYSEDPFIIPGNYCWYQDAGVASEGIDPYTGGTAMWYNSSLNMWATNSYWNSDFAFKTYVLPDDHCYTLDPFCNTLNFTIAKDGLITGIDDDCGYCPLRIAGYFDFNSYDWVIFSDFKPQACGHTFEYGTVVGFGGNGEFYRYYPDGILYISDPVEIQLMPCGTLGSIQEAAGVIDMGRSSMKDSDQDNYSIDQTNTPKSIVQQCCYALNPFCTTLNFTIEQDGLITGIDDDCGYCPHRIGGYFNFNTYGWVIFLDFQPQDCGHTFEYGIIVGFEMSGNLYRYYPDGTLNISDPIEIQLMPCASTCNGDFDHDSDVDDSDLVAFAVNFGAMKYNNALLYKEDFDWDGDVDGSDLRAFALGFGRTNCQALL